MNRFLALGFALLALASAAASVWVVRSGHEPQARTDRPSVQANALTAPWKLTDDTVDGCPREDTACITQAWSNRAYAEPAAATLTALESAARSDPSLAQGCHQVTHRIGAAAFTRLDGDVGSAILEGSAACQGGYYHGVMQELVRVDRRPLSEVVADACTLREGTSGAVRNNCLHGLGHGVTIHLGWELPDALKACDALQDNDRLACSGGVFMETFTPSVEGLLTRWNRPQGPNWPCSEVHRKDRSECHYVAGLLHLRETGGDLTAFAARCGQVEAVGKERCAEALGANAMAVTQRDVARVVAACDGLDANEDACILGAARATASWRGRPEDAAGLCARAGGPQRPACWEGVGNIARMVSPSENAARTRCSSIVRSAAAPSAALGWCLDGRALTPSSGGDHARG